LHEKDGIPVIATAESYGSDEEVGYVQSILGSMHKKGRLDKENDIRQIAINDYAGSPAAVSTSDLEYVCSFQRKGFDSSDGNWRP
jgi:hypothetical protein